MMQTSEMKRHRKQNQRGFTLAETLLAILILALVGTIVTAGIPTAKNAYEKVVLSSNADVLFSTTVTTLRNELGTAQNIKSDTSGIEYYNPTRGTLSKISVDSEKGIMINRFYGSSEDQKVPLISSKTATGDLYVTFSEISYSNEIVTVKGLSVKRESAADPLVSQESLSIRVISK